MEQIYCRSKDHILPVKHGNHEASSRVDPGAARMKPVTLPSPGDSGFIIHLSNLSHLKVKVAHHS
jgi:hypothetical protein